jgi:hypothetical protein
LLSSKDFVRHAVLVCLIFAVAHFCGLREFTSVLNGTTGSTDLDWQTSAVLGVTYILLYLAFVLLAPTMILAAALLALWRKFIRRTAPLTPALSPGERENYRRPVG